MVVGKTFNLRQPQHVRTEGDEEGSTHKYLDVPGQRIPTDGSDTAKSLSPQKASSSNLLGSDGLPTKGMRGSVASSKQRTMLTRQSTKPISQVEELVRVENKFTSRKVAYNFEKNCERRALIDSHVDIDLSLLLLTSNTVSGFDNESHIFFDHKKEGYMLSIATIKFKLKSLPQDGRFHLDFSGDEIFAFSVNGNEIPLAELQWKENQILLPFLKKGSTSNENRWKRCDYYLRQ